MQVAQVKRPNVTIDDRRAVIVMARGRKPQDVAKVPHEAFIRNLLKNKLGWDRKEPASDSIKAAAKHLAESIIREEKEACDKADAKKAAEAAAKEVA